MQKTQKTQSLLVQEDSPGEENANPLQYSRLENPMERGAWKATAHRVAEPDTTAWPSTAQHKSSNVLQKWLTLDSVMVGKVNIAGRSYQMIFIVLQDLIRVTDCMQLVRTGLILNFMTLTFWRDKTDCLNCRMFYIQDLPDSLTGDYLTPFSPYNLQRMCFSFYMACIIYIIAL